MKHCPFKVCILYPTNTCDTCSYAEEDKKEKVSKVFQYYHHVILDEVRKGTDIETFELGMGCDSFRHAITLTRIYSFIDEETGIKHVCNAESIIDGKVIGICTGHHYFHDGEYTGGFILPEELDFPTKKSS